MMMKKSVDLKFFFHSFELILFEICQKKEKRKRENC